MVNVVVNNSDSDVVDFRGNPVDKSNSGGWVGAGLILGSEVSERICVMGLSMNLVTYLVGTLHLPSSKSATIVTNCLGTLNLFGLLAGFLADAKLGRYFILAISASITCLGMIMLTIATTIPSMRPPPCTTNQHEYCIQATPTQLALLYAALYTIAVGGGGIKCNVSGFGSDQFDSRDPKEEKAMVLFFNRFYFCISIGSLFAVTVMVYIQDNVGRGWGYGISAGTMLIALITFVCGTPKYRYMKPQGSPLTLLWRVLFLAWKKRNLASTHPTHLNGYHCAKIFHSNRLECLDKAATIDGDVMVDWMVSSVTQVEEVKMVIKLIPIWSTCILFWTVYSQMTTFTVEQATFMDRRIGSFIVPAASLSSFLIITILLFTSLNEKVFVPVARKFTRSDQGLTSLQRVGIGLIFSMGAMVVAAAVEKQRRLIVVHDNTLSAFWLVPQLFLVGAGEAFVYVGELEFFIREAPDRMKSMSTGLFLCAISMGFYVSSLLVSIVDKFTKKRWLQTNLNKASLDNFYWLLAVLGLLNFVLFLTFAMKHQYKVQQNIKFDDNSVKEFDGCSDGTMKEINKEEFGEGP